MSIYEIKDKKNKNAYEKKAKKLNIQGEKEFLVTWHGLFFFFYECLLWNMF
jgi:hypothetical protein